jgi:PAS domain S-box-containing protein
VESINKEWFDLILKIADYHKDPVFILNDSFEIVFTNQIANSFFLIDDSDLTLNQIFDSTTVKTITDLIGISVSLNQKSETKQIEVTLKSDQKFILDLTIQILRSGLSNKYILVFSFDDKNILSDSTDKIKIGTSLNYSTEQNTIIKALVNEINELVPFTIISLNRLQLLFEKITIPGLLTDANGKILAISSDYADYLQVEISFAVGKKLEIFLPEHLNQTYKLIDEMAKSNKQQVILERKSKKINNIEVFKSFIHIPILDNLNQIVAIVGLIIDIKRENLNDFQLEPQFGKLLEQLPIAIALLNPACKFLNASNEFGRLISREVEQIISGNIYEIFPKSFADFFTSFIDDNVKETSFVLDADFNIAESKNYFVEALLKKSFTKENNVLNILLILNKHNNFEKSFDELQNILMYRGKMFDILIEKNPEPIFIYDKENLRFLEVNIAAVKLYGYSKDEFLEMDLTDLYAPEDIQTLLDSFGDESSESRFSKPFRHRKKDGTNVLVEISKTSFLFNDREAHFNIVKDITSDIETDKQNQMLKAIFSETDLMVFSTDSSGFIKFANHRVKEKLGYLSEELIQSAFASLVIDDDRGIVNTSIFQSYLKDTIALETKFKLNNGEFIEVEVYASPIFDFNGETDSFTIVVKTKNVAVDSVAPKEIVKEVIKEVVKEVVVEKQVKVEQKSAIPDSNFLSGMFHEILTPINVIIGFSQELISSTENPTEEQKEAAEIINQNRIKMMDTMNSVVEYSDIIQNKSPLKVEAITITEIIEKLDTNIKDISGINDILFSYGKISSSLKFNSDLQKFESFIQSLIKVVSRLSKDKKIYFSAFALDTDSFLLGISDQYGNPSEYVSNVLEQVYNNNRDPKDFGLPKLTTYLSKTLLSLLDGKFYRSSAISVRSETGFIFPLNLTQKTEVRIFETEQASNSPELPSEIFKQSEFPVQESEIFQESNEIVEENLSELNLTEENIPSNEEQSVTENFEEEQIYQDDNVVPESIDSIQTVEDYYTSFANEVISEEIKEKEIESEKAQEKIDESTQENISQEINQELESDIFAEPEMVVPKTVDLSKFKCLYIEDQIDSQILFKVQMKGLNDVKFAASFEDAQLLLLNYQFDFIVMDINLQGEYNGLDALKIIKTMPAFSIIPIIAVTAYVLPGDKEKFIAAGFDDFISKPIFREKMMESIEKIFLS